MSPGDRLLYAISAKREMSWPVFKRTFELLCMHDLAERSLEDMKFARYETARTLDALGHIEADFDWPNARLYAAPPALSLLPSSGLPVALLSGARAPNTLDLLSASIEQRSGSVALAVRNQSDESKRFPARVTVIGESSGDLASLAQEVGLTFQKVPPSWGILNFAGSLSEYLSGCQWLRTDELNWESRQFSVVVLRFSAPQSDGGLRLFRYTHPTRQYPIHYLWRGNAAARVDPDWGRFAALKEAGRNIVHYDRSSSSVVIPATVPLPKLLSRALCFCSGLIPQIAPAAAVAGSPVTAPRFRVYPSVPWEFARLLALKLDQTLITDFTLLDSKND
jgi:hypothetical protein